MTERLTPIERIGQQLVDAQVLERVAGRIAATMYDHSDKIEKGYRPDLYITWDDADELREIAARLGTGR